MSVRKFIRENLPEAWDKAATELKMRTELVERLYGAIPQYYKNRYHYKKAIKILYRIFDTNVVDCNIIHLVDATDINLTKWNELSNKIKEYEYQCM